MGNVFGKPIPAVDTVVVKMGNQEFPESHCCRIFKGRRKKFEAFLNQGMGKIGSAYP